MRDGHPGRGREAPLVYVCYEFPVLTQTFTRAEVEGLDGAGIDLELVSCRRPAEDPGSGTREVRYLPRPSSIALPLGFLSWMVRRPLRTLGLLLTVATARYRDQPFLCWSRGFLQLLWGAFLAGEYRGKRAHFHAQFVDAASTVAMVAARLTDGTFSFTNHTAYNPYLLRPKLRHCAGAFSISEFDREDMGGSEKIEVVYQGIDVTAFAPRPVGPAGDPARILSVGALREKKGHHVLVEAVRLLAEEGRRVELAIVGEGPERGRLEDLGGPVTLLGAAPPERIAGFLAEADVFALACVVAANGDLDGIPVSLMEAMAAGVPVVSTKLSGIPELIEDGVEGILVPSGDAAALAEALARTIDDRAAAAERAARAREKVERQHDVRRSVARMAAALRRLSSR
jgi:glycosyltransferase involved in cell wall biosynthesis